MKIRSPHQNAFGSLAAATTATLLGAFAFLLLQGHAVAGNGEDSDGDGVPDAADNCIEVPNTDQFDADADTFGNACDADLNDDCVVSFEDLARLREVFFSTDPTADFNNDSAVNFADLAIMKAQFFTSPGPSSFPLPGACYASITVSPDRPVPLAGDTIQFEATATLPDGSEKMVTQFVDWSSSLESNVTVSNADGSEGEATVLTQGSTAISAKNAESGVVGVTTVQYNNGYFLSLSNVEFDNGPTSVTVAPGTSVSVSAAYTIWSRIGCPACVDYIVFGVDGDGQSTLGVGIPGTFPGESGGITRSVVAPNAIGEYTVYGMLAPQLSSGAALSQYETSFPGATTEPSFIPLGTIRVE
ncbi:MAG: hypothetical protein AAFN78_10475 [Pseudomonadota bacterium]